MDSRKAWHKRGIFERSLENGERTRIGKLASIGGFAVLCLLVISSVAPLRAQVDTGRISGMVSDKSGGVVPGATVALTNEGTGLRLVMKTGATGYYMFPGLKAGTYNVEIEAAGFAKFLQLGIPLNIQQDVVINAILQVGSVAQTVEVTGAVPLLQTGTAMVGQVVSQQQVNDLPLNGRNFTFLAQLTVGVTQVQDNPRGMNATGSFTANGTRFELNDYLLDAIDNNNQSISWTNGQVYVVLPPVDAVQEFKVQTSNYSAEFGRAAGAVVNATTKSGTNQFHGDVWEFLRNDALDSADFFENAAGIRKGEYRQNQFGFTLGGPVMIPHVYNGRDKTFFFGDYQGTRLRQGNVWTNTVPTLAERNSGYTNFSGLIAGQSGSQTDDLGRAFPLGTIFDPATTRPVTAGQADAVTGLVATSSGYVRDPFAGNQVPTSRLDPNAVRLLNLLPLPTSSSLFTNAVTEPVTSSTTNSFDTRVDQDFSAHDQMFARVSYFNNPAFIPGPYPGIADGGSIGQGSQAFNAVNAAWSETHIFSPSLINEARLGFSRLYWGRPQPYANTMGIPAEYGIQGIPQFAGNGGLPNLSITGLTSFGSSTYKPSVRWSTTSQITENLTKIVGSHTLKAGVEFQRLAFPWIGPSAPHGSFSFSGAYTDVPSKNSGNTGPVQFLLTPVNSTVPGGVNDVGAADGVGDSPLLTVDNGRDYYGLYLQDDWRATSKLSLNVGLRWEYFQAVEENHDAQDNFVLGSNLAGAQLLVPQQRSGFALPQPVLAAMQEDGVTLVPTSNQLLVNSQFTNFAPRFGLSYRLGPKIVVRAGYGLFHNGLDNIGGSPNLGFNYPFQFALSYSSPDPDHPITANNSIGLLENGLLNVSVVPASVNPSGIGWVGHQVNFLTPYMEDANLTVQYALTPNQSFQVGYVGSWARHLQVPVSSNPLTSILPPSASVQNAVVFPQFGRGGSDITQQGNGYYNSLQAQFERRFSQGFDFLAGFTYARNMTDAADPLFSGTFGGLRAPWVPGFGIQGDYQLAGFDIEKAVHFSGSYRLPIGSGERYGRNLSGAANQIFGGWNLNWILTLEDGPPLTIGCTVTTAAGSGCYALGVPGQNPIGGKHNVNQWMNPSAFANPPVATAISQTNFAPLGGEAGQVFGPGIHRLDFSIFKQFRIGEQRRLEFRTEFFNLPNTPDFADPGFSAYGVPATPGVLTFTNTTNFGKITSTRDSPNDPRQIQFALKLYF